MATTKALSLQLARDLSGQDKAGDIKRVVALNRGLATINDLSACFSLQRLDVSHNLLTNFNGIVHCRGLTWLNLSHNRLVSLEGVNVLTSLVVLNASHNEIEATDDLSPLQNLKALVLSSNRLSEIPGLASLSNLNTLDNLFRSISLSTLTQLTKVSLSQNSLTRTPRGIKNCPNIRELRLNGNKISKLKKSLSNISKLLVLDVGKNLIAKLDDVAVLKTFQALKSLNLKGSEVCNERNYRHEILQMCLQLQSLDGAKLTSKEFTATETKHKLSRELDSDLCDEEKIINKKAKLEDTATVVEENVHIYLPETETKLDEHEAKPVPSRGRHKSRAKQGPSGLVSIETVKRKTKSPPVYMDLFENSTKLPSWN